MRGKGDTHNNGLTTQGPGGTPFCRIRSIRRVCMRLEHNLALQPEPIAQLNTRSQQRRHCQCPARGVERVHEGHGEIRQWLARHYA
jgi:hypothetical protein